MACAAYHRRLAASCWAACRDRLRDEHDGRPVRGEDRQHGRPAGALRVDAWRWLHYQGPRARHHRQRRRNLLPRLVVHAVTACIELAIAGGAGVPGGRSLYLCNRTHPGVPPMLPGGIRRVMCAASNPRHGTATARHGTATARHGRHSTTRRCPSLGLRPLASRSDLHALRLPIRATCPYVPLASSLAAGCAAFRPTRRRISLTQIWRDPTKTTCRSPVRTLQAACSKQPVVRK